MKINIDLEKWKKKTNFKKVNSGKTRKEIMNINE